jgi:hypothetical protein
MIHERASEIVNTVRDDWLTVGWEGSRTFTCTRT